MKIKNCRQGTRVELKVDYNCGGQDFYKGMMGTITDITLQRLFAFVSVKFDNGERGVFSHKHLRRLK